MKLHYAGKYDGDEKHLPKRTRPEDQSVFGILPFLLFVMFWNMRHLERWHFCNRNGSRNDMNAFIPILSKVEKSDDIATLSWGTGDQPVPRIY